MSRIAQTFARLQQQQRKALIPYLVAGDPDPAITVPAMHALVAAGADIIELGVPFSDPMAEGPVIQLAHERALEHGVSLRDVLSMIKCFRQSDNETPIVLMGYANPVEAMGYELFAEQASGAGVDGVLTVDLPPEEAVETSALMASHGIDSILLLAPTTAEERVKTICEQARGYLYYVSLKGVTGAGNLDVQSVSDKMEMIRRYSTLPVAVGFGIKDATTASAVAPLCDGVVVGSALVDCLVAKFDPNHPAQTPASATELISAIRSAIDTV